MSDTRRDIELRIRAQDLTTAADLNKISAAVDTLSAAIDHQVAAATKGTGSLAELRESMIRLEDAGKGAANLGGLLDRFKDLTGVVEANRATVDRAREASARYRVELENTGKGTKAEEAQLARLVKAIENAEKAYASNQATLQAVGEALKKAGLDTNDLVASQERLTAVADKIGPALTKVNEATLSYARISREAKTAAAELATEQQRVSAVMKSTADQEARAAEQLKQSFAATNQYIDRNKQNDATAIGAAIKANKEKADAAAKADADIAKRQRENDANLIGLTIRKNEAQAAEEKKAYDKRLADLRAANDKERAEYSKRVADVRKANQEGNAAAQTRGGSGALGGAAVTGIFGLKPYELQNLSYQINDVVTGFISGQRATQIAAQQGGQILQLFNRNIFDLLKYLPLAAAGFGVLSVAFGAVSHAFREQSSIREFRGLIIASADGAKYSAEQLTALRSSVRELGIGWADAGALIRTGINNGLSTNRIKEFAQIARDIADVTGEEVPAAMEKLTKASKQGLSGIQELESQYHFLTLEQYKEIKALNDSEGATAATGRAVAILKDRFREAASQAVSPFTQASRDLSTAWNSLLDTLAKSDVVQGVVRLMTDMVGAIDKAARATDALVKSYNAFSDLKVPPGYFGSPTLFKIISVLRAATGNTAGIQADLNKTGETEKLKSQAAGQGFATTEGRVVTAPGVEIRTETQKVLANILAEAAKTTLPEGQKFEIFSATSDRPGNPTSEHPQGRAFDVRVVDANGKPVDNGVVGRPSMGGGLPTPEMEAAIVAAAAKLNAGPIAVGGTFKSNPDPGHVSLGGQEAVTNARNRGETIAITQQETQALEQQKIIGQTLLDQDRERILRANTALKAARDELTTKIGQVAYDKAIKEGADEGSAQELKRQAILLETSQIRQKELGYQDEQNVMLKQQKENAAAVLEAGQKASAAALERANREGILLTQEDLHTAQLKGQSEEIAKIQDLERARNEMAEIRKGIAGLDRANNQRALGDVQALVQAEKEKFAVQEENLEKLARHNPERQAEVEALKAQLETTKAIALANAELKGYVTAADTAAKTRKESTEAYKALLDAGVISQTEFEEKNRVAFGRSATAIDELSAKFKEFVANTKGLDPATVELFTAKMQALKAEASYVSPLFKAIKDAAGEGFTQGITQSFNTIAEAVGNLVAKTGTMKDVLASVKVAVGQFFSTLLKDIGEAILKYEALKIASEFTKSGDDSKDGGGGLGILGKIFGLFTGGGDAPIGGDYGGGGAHEGTIVGLSSRPTTRHGYNTDWLANAPRAHQGAMPGLQPDEYGYVLKKGEEVLKSEDPRNALNAFKNAGKSGGTNQVAIRNVLVADPEFVPQGMAGAKGEQVVVSIIKSNIPTIRQLLRD